MAKIHTLKINNFRGINYFEQVFGLCDFVCLIGRGDSGKTTLLNAIAYVLNPNWNLALKDTDFHNCNTSKPIEIEATLYDLPKQLIKESKFGLYIRGIDVKDNTVKDEIANGQEIALTLKLTVEKNLEPKWHIVNSRQDPIEISSTDRARFNMFQISDYLDNHFSWDNRSPLKALFNLDEDESSIKDVLTESIRNLKQQIDKRDFKEFSNVLKKITASAKIFGIDISNVSTSLDLKNISFSDSRFSLHDSIIPFRLKGKGSRRLISIAIQAELANSGGIILIDEIEQGLEPDRSQHLVKTLKTQNKGQVFITTHSRDVLVELQAKNLFIVRKSNTSLIKLNSSLQGVVRMNPEAFFSNRIIVCEGPTEIGFCRSLNNHRIDKGKDNVALLGIRLVNGVGNNYVSYSEEFFKCGYDVCTFCDSDNEPINQKKEALIKAGIVVADCQDKFSLEEQLFADLPWGAIKDMVMYAIDERGLASIKSSVENKFKEKYNEQDYAWIKVDSEKIRKILGETSKKEGWYKRIDHGEKIGDIYNKYSLNIEKSHIYSQMNKISNWIDNV